MVLFALSAATPSDHWMNMHHPFYLWNGAVGGQGVSPSVVPSDPTNILFMAQNYAQNVMNMAAAELAKAGCFAPPGQIGSWCAHADSLGSS